MLTNEEMLARMGDTSLRIVHTGCVLLLEDL